VFKQTDTIHAIAIVLRSCSTSAQLLRHILKSLVKLRCGRTTAVRWALRSSSLSASSTILRFGTETGRCVRTPFIASRSPPRAEPARVHNERRRRGAAHSGLAADEDPTAAGAEAARGRYTPQERTRAQPTRAADPRRIATTRQPTRRRSCNTRREMNEANNLKRRNQLARRR
jgi:hypothetical protein